MLAGGGAWPVAASEQPYRRDRLPDARSAAMHPAAHTTPVRAVSCVCHTPRFQQLSGGRKNHRAEGSAWEGGLHPGEGAPWEPSSLLLPGGDVFPGLWGHSAQGQRQRGYPGVVQEATAKWPTPVALCHISYMCI